MLQPARLRDAGALELPRDRQKIADTTKDKKKVSFYGDVDGEGLLDQLEKRAASESVELAKKDDYRMKTDPARWMLILTGHADSDAKVKKNDVVRFLVKHSMFVLKRKLQQADKTLGVGQELIATWVADTLLTTAEGMQPSSTTLSQHHLIKHWSLVLDPLLKQLLPPPPPPPPPLPPSGKSRAGSSSWRCFCRGADHTTGQCGGRYHQLPETCP
jgi:hypothetical protein